MAAPHVTGAALAARPGPTPALGACEAPPRGPGAAVPPLIPGLPPYRAAVLAAGRSGAERRGGSSCCPRPGAPAGEGSASRLSELRPPFLLRYGSGCPSLLQNGSACPPLFQNGSACPPLLQNGSGCPFFLRYGSGFLSLPSSRTSGFSPRGLAEFARGRLGARHGRVSVGTEGLYSGAVRRFVFPGFFPVREVLLVSETSI